MAWSGPGASARRPRNYLLFCASSLSLTPSTEKGMRLCGNKPRRVDGGRLKFDFHTRLRRVAGRGGARPSLA